MPLLVLAAACAARTEAPGSAAQMQVDARQTETPPAAAGHAAAADEMPIADEGSGATLRPPLGAVLRESYSQCQEQAGGVTPAMQACISHEWEFQSARMAAALEKLSASLGVEGRNALVAEQLAWQQRDTQECPWNPAIDGQAQRLVANECSLERTALRADLLTGRIGNQR